jgi:hypothetical protein
MRQARSAPQGRRRARATLRRVRKARRGHTPPDRGARDAPQRALRPLSRVPSAWRALPRPTWAPARPARLERCETSMVARVRGAGAFWGVRRVQCGAAWARRALWVLPARPPARRAALRPAVPLIQSLPLRPPVPPPAYGPPPAPHRAAAPRGVRGARGSPRSEGPGSRGWSGGGSGRGGGRSHRGRARPRPGGRRPPHGTPGGAAF